MTCSQLYSGITTVSDERIKKNLQYLLLANPNLVTTTGR